MFALGVQIAAAGVRLRAMIAVIVNGFVEIGFGFFHRMLTLRAVICVEDWRNHEEYERNHHDRRYCLFAKS